MRHRTGVLLERLRQQDQARSELATELTAARAAAADAGRELIRAEAELAAGQRLAQEQERRTAAYLADIAQIKQSLQTEFQAAASRTMEEKTARFTDHNRAQVEAILQPLRQQLSDFRTRVDTVYKTESDDRVSLRTQIEQLRVLNHRITDEAHALTRALKGQSQTRGAWGELVLERLLESAGLRPGEDYLTQTSHVDDHGRRLRPDVLVRLPDNRHLVIDAKVSLLAYEQATNAPDEAARAEARRLHLAAVRRHVEDLAAKRYDRAPGLQSPDYVFMFMPLEPALHLALETDPALFEWAAERHVVLVSAPGLLATLKTVATLWTQERQTRNVQEIARRGGLLYDKFAGLYQDLEAMGKHLERARGSHQDVMAKLATGRGNLLSQVEELKTLGATAQRAMVATESGGPGRPVAIATPAV